MKWLKFNTKEIVIESDIGEEDIQRQVITPLMVEYTADGRAYAQKLAYDGVITEYDDGEPDPNAMPTQMDAIEAQVAYTAMITDTLLEV